MNDTGAENRNSCRDIAAIVYDLDGTLLDTLADLAHSSNQVLRALGYPIHPVDAYRYFVGDGVRELIRRCLPENRRNDSTIIDRGVGMMAEMYAGQWHVNTRVYPGITEMIARAGAAGLPQTILSNKPDAFTREMTDHYFPDHPFTEVRGQVEGVPKKPDPGGALALANALCVAPERVLYLGDTSTDMQTAVAAGMFAVGACWGFRPREELAKHGAQVLADHPQSVADLFPRPSTAW